jgi:hypothetical protein
MKIYIHIRSGVLLVSNFFLTRENRYLLDSILSTCIYNTGVDLKPDLLTPQAGLLTPSAVGRRKKRQAAGSTIGYDTQYNAPAVSRFFSVFCSHRTKITIDTPV